MWITVAAYSFSIAAGAFLGHFELHTDDTGVEVLFILLATFLLGCLRPAHAWQWSPLVGLWIPGAELLFNKAPVNASTASVAAFVLAIGLAGSYLGVIARKAVP
ncbi:MAG: hypothetical protein JO323_22475 [Acidobacteriia bacterium]|nr:hypothetical protein [Terriglobia bacterium]